jgi:hypothetical protein
MGSNVTMSIPEFIPAGILDRLTHYTDLFIERLERKRVIIFLKDILRRNLFRKNALFYRDRSEETFRCKDIKNHIAAKLNELIQDEVKETVFFKMKARIIVRQGLTHTIQ